MRIPVSFVLIPGIEGRGRVFRQDTGQEIGGELPVSSNPWLPWPIGAEITLVMFERPIRIRGGQISTYSQDVVVVEHREMRPERLLPPASTDEQKLDRGVCLVCFVRLAECMRAAMFARMAAVLKAEREAPTGPAPSEVSGQFNAELAKSSKKCCRKGCELPGAWAPRIEIRPWADYKGKPITAWVTLTVCDQHRAWFIETSGDVVRNTESQVRAAGLRVDSTLTKLVLEPVQSHSFMGGRA